MYVDYVILHNMYCCITLCWWNTYIWQIYTKTLRYFFYRYHSFNNQIICDPFGRIIDSIAGIPGAVHDANIWDSSSILKRIRNGEIMNESSKIIDGFTIRPFLLADAAYPVRNFMLCPYKQAYATTSARK